MRMAHYFKKNIKKIVFMTAGMFLSLSVISCASKDTSGSNSKYDPFAPPPRQFGTQKNMSASDRIALLEKDNEALKKALRESNTRSSKMWVLVEELELKQQNLLGEVDTLRRQNEEILPLLENKLAKQEGEILVIRSQLGIDEGMTVAEIKESNVANSNAGVSGAKAPTKASDSASKQTDASLYNASLELFKKRKYGDAVESLKALIKMYPQSKYVPNAHFWMGESRYQAGDYTAAALAYEDVIKKYPKSSKIAASYLKQGMSFVKLKNFPVAKIRLNHVIQKFPNSQEAKRAEKELENIKNS